MPTKPEVINYYSHGKLLISGEYLVLDGALALAVPTRQGQSMSIESFGAKRPQIIWESYTHQGKCWFSGHFSLPDGNYIKGTDIAVGQRLEQILKAGKELQALLWTKKTEVNYSVRTDLEFPRSWGLGTSSTLIANLSKWWEVDPYQLLEKTFGGSGYDLACAEADGALFYRLSAGRPQVSSVKFDPPFRHQLYFLYLGKKQNSRSGIASYREKGRPPEDLLEKISNISRAMTEVTHLSDFLILLEEHEEYIAAWMEKVPVRQQLFPEFSGQIKSLGAWGGDFVLVASALPFPKLKTYFSDKGYQTLIPFAEMILADENASLNSN